MSFRTIQNSKFKIQHSTFLLLLFFSPLSAQSLSGWDHAFINNRRDSLMFFTSVSLAGDIEAAFTLNRRISERWEFSTSAMATTKDYRYIGALRERDDLPFVFSSGRFISGEIRYEGEKLNLRLGRLFPDYHPLFQKTPHAVETISSDGIDWSYGRGFWRFANRITYLKNERIDNRAINRIFNFHALYLTFGKWTLGLGEFLIYTGDNRSVDWIWSNPFISYVVHNYDAYPGEGADASEYGGDTDNSMFYFELGRKGERAAFTARLYLDEFQIDADDREHATDDFLLHTQMIINAGRKNKSAIIPKSFVITASIASARFGYHSGLFTSFYVNDYSLLPAETGRVRHVSLAGLWQGKNWHIIADFRIGRYKDILSLTPDQYSSRKSIETLEGETRTGLRCKASFQPFKNTALWIDSSIIKENSLFTIGVVQYINF